MSTVCKNCNHLVGSEPHECPSAEYNAAKRVLMDAANEAIEEFSEDELEEFAAKTPT